MRFRYTPFDKALKDILPSDLQTLRLVSEGWYVEYKSKVIPVRKLAKSLSAFANQYGGWLFLGVEEDSETHMAKGFPGIYLDEVNKLIQMLKEAARSLLTPEVFYETRVLNGPIDEVGLSQDRAIVIVRIPAGGDTPYVHADGKIFRRVADSSDPKAENDRFVFDRLWERGERSRERLRNFVTRTPVTAENEKQNSYLHLTISSDPYELGSKSFQGNFDDFAAIMKSNPIPFDSFYSRSGGFIARQIANNNPFNRLFTWEFDWHCHSFITLPINVFNDPYMQSMMHYSTGRKFGSMLRDSGIRHSKILDLNILFEAIYSIVIRHRTLAEKAGIDGPFYVKAHLQNVWRTVPFLDMSSFVAHIVKYNIPVVQDDHALAPPGTNLESFVLLPERDSQSLSPGDMITDGVYVFIPILAALGIPADFLRSPEAIKELHTVAERFKAAQTLRNG